MGYVYYTNYIEWFECGRTELLRDIGYPYSQMETDNIYLPVVEVYARYRKPAQYDKMITVVSCIKEIPKPKIKIEYRIFDEKQKVLLAEGYTIHTFLNESKKPTKVPQKFLNFINKYFDK